MKKATYRLNSQLRMLCSQIPSPLDASAVEHHLLRPF